MPTIPHVEKHFTGSESVRDVVIGMADGLTVPFALAAGLSAAVTSTHIIVTAGLAEIAAPHGFFEWNSIKEQKASKPYAIAMKDSRPLGVGGFWEN